MDNNYIGFIFEAHHMTNCFRVAKNMQMGADKNYIIVCCDPSYNGVYEWDAKYKKYCKTWKNKNLECYCVPDIYCKKIMNLEDVKNPALIAQIQAMQKNFVNRGYRKNEKQKWMI